MTTQTERLADTLDVEVFVTMEDLKEAAAELRRLEAVNKELLDEVARLNKLASSGQRTQQDCTELAQLGWQAVCCPSCGNAGAKGYPRKFTPSLNQQPCGYEHHEHRPYGAPGEVRIHAVLASQYKMPDGTIADDFQWLIDEYKADPNTIKLLPLYTTPQAPKENT